MKNIELRDDVAETKTCSICGILFMSWGNNAAPITDGRCCDECNNLVIARRINDMRVNERRTPTKKAGGSENYKLIRMAGCRARFSGGAGGPTR